MGASQKLLRNNVSKEELDKDYRGLIGLLAEESLIGQRLGKFGRKKAVTTETAGDRA